MCAITALVSSKTEALLESVGIDATALPQSFLKHGSLFLAQRTGGFLKHSVALGKVVFPHFMNDFGGGGEALFREMAEIFNDGFNGTHYLKYLNGVYRIGKSSFAVFSAVPFCRVELARA